MTPFHCCAVFRKEDNVVMSGSPGACVNGSFPSPTPCISASRTTPDEKSLENDPPISGRNLGKKLMAESQQESRVLSAICTSQFDGH